MLFDVVVLYCSLLCEGLLSLGIEVNVFFVVVDVCCVWGGFVIVVINFCMLYMFGDV